MVNSAFMYCPLVNSGGIDDGNHAMKTIISVVNSALCIHSSEIIPVDAWILSQSYVYIDSA